MKTFTALFIVVSLISSSSLYGQVKEGYYSMKIGYNRAVCKIKRNKIKTYGLHETGEFAIGIGTFTENKEDSLLIAHYKKWKHNFDYDTVPDFQASDTLKLVRQKDENVWVLKRYTLRDEESKRDLADHIRERTRWLFTKKYKPSKQTTFR